MSADVVTRNINGGAINHRRTSSIPVKSSKTGSTPPHSPSRSSRSTAVLRDSNNTRSSSLEPGTTSLTEKYVTDVHVHVVTSVCVSGGEYQ